MTRLLDLGHNYYKCISIICSKGIGVMATARFCLETDGHTDGRQADRYVSRTNFFGG